MLAEIAVESELAVVEADVLNEETPVLSEPIPVLALVLSEAISLTAPDKLVDRELAVVLRDDTPVESELMPLVTVDSAVLVDVESDEIPVDALVLSEEMPVLSELAAAEADVLSEEMPVLSEPIPLVTVDNPVLVEVESEEIPVLVDVLSVSIAVLVAYSCEPLIASVLSFVTSPAATLVICRSAPGAPTLTTLCGFVPANV